MAIWKGRPSSPAAPGRRIPRPSRSQAAPLPGAASCRWRTFMRFTACVLPLAARIQFAIMIATTDRCGHGANPCSRYRTRCEGTPAAARRAARAQHGSGGSRHPPQRRQGGGPAPGWTWYGDLCLVQGPRPARRRGDSRVARPCHQEPIRGMIILDTNVISACMREQADDAALRWLDRQPRVSVWTTAITVLEIRFGLDAMPDGRRRQARSEAF